jgi:hypothetical protein
VSIQLHISSFIIQCRACQYHMLYLPNSPRVARETTNERVRFVSEQIYCTRISTCKSIPPSPHLFTRLFLSLLRLRFHFFSNHSEISPNLTNKTTSNILAAVIGIATAK